MQKVTQQNLNTVMLVMAIAALFTVVYGADLALAKNSLGLGNAEQAIVPEGPFASLLFWIQQQQKSFYSAMTHSLKEIRSGHGGAFWLIGLSFAYGVLHAAGPGHGKAVISSYMLASQTQLRRGILLSFVSAGLQASVGVLVIGSLAFLLRGMGLKQVDLSHNLEVLSYVGVSLLGLWMLWKSLKPKPQPHRAHSHSHSHEHAHVHSSEHTHSHAEGEVCSQCGHSHLPDPKALEGKFGISEAVSVVFAVGMRPCTGALIVLSFAFLNGIYWAGIISVFAMAIGTGITVSSIASMAVGAKNLTLYYSKATIISAGTQKTIEIAGAGFILFLGLTLLAASIY